MHKHYDICICGGGIAGLVMAFALGQKGKSVLVAERNSSFNANGADVLKPSGIQVLQDLGLYNALIKGGAIMRDKVLIYHGGELISEMDYKKEHLRKHFFLIPYQKLLAIILKQIQAIPNIHLLFNTELKGAILDNGTDQIGSVLLNDQTVSATVYIGADGITSKLRSLLNLEASIDYYTQRLYFAQFPMVKSVETSNRLYIDKNNTLAYFYPVTHDQFRCIIGLSKEEGDRYFLYNKDIGLIKERLSHFVSESNDAIAAISSLDHFVTFPLCKMNLETYYKGNAVFLGNAAHSIHPLTGQGMNLAIEDAGTLYPLLEEVLNGSENLAAALMHYQEVRHPLTEKLIDYGHKLVSSFNDKELFRKNLNLQLQSSNRIFEIENN